VDDHSLVAIFRDDMQYLVYNLDNSVAEFCVEISTGENKIKVFDD
jgi:hypothetical protein